MTTVCGPAQLCYLMDLKYGEYCQIDSLGDMIFLVLRPIVKTVGKVLLADTNDGQQLSIDCTQRASKVDKPF